MERWTAAKVQKSPAPVTNLQAQSARSSSAAHPLLELQRSIGNHAVQRLINSPYIQTKLRVSAPGNPFEQEADEPVVRRAPLAVREEDEEEKVAPKIDPNQSAQEAVTGKIVEARRAKDTTLQRRVSEDEEKEEEGPQFTPPLVVRREELKTQRRVVVQTRPDPRQTSPAPAAPASPDLGAIPAGGQRVDRVGIINRDTTPEVRLRASPDTGANNIITTLPFNTIVQVIKSFPGGWFFVSTAAGEMGYVASIYVSMNAPEPNARLHRVEPGVKGTAIAIAERYYGQYAADWGQDLRFYVNVLAWANKISVPDETGGWRQVHFNAGNLIWVPSYSFARSLKGVVNSGSISYEVLDKVGLAGIAKRLGQFAYDLRDAIYLSKDYLLDAIVRHVEQALINALYSVALMIIGAIAILAVTTAIGAAIGALFGGVGAAPGAAIGFEVGMILLEWLGLALLLVWIGQALVETGRAFGRFLTTVWRARGDKKLIDLAAQEYAEAVGVLIGNLVEALVLFAASAGISKGVGVLRASKFGKAMGETRGGEWLSERVRRVRAGETKIVGPRRALSRFFRGVELVDPGGKPIGEFDGVNLSRRMFVENKAATGLERVNPRTGRPAQTPAEWAQKQVFKKTDTRIKNLGKASGTRVTAGGSKTVPTLAEIQGIRHVHFVIDANTPALRAAVFAEMANLRATYPGWTFTAEFGISIFIPPVPDKGVEETTKGK